MINKGLLFDNVELYTGKQIALRFIWYAFSLVVGYVLQFACMNAAEKYNNQSTLA